MAWYSTAVGRAGLLICAALPAVVVPFGHAGAQARLELSHSITVARFSIAEITMLAEIGAGEYTISGNGRVLGFARALASGTASSNVRGTVEGLRLAPTRFSSKSNFGGEPREVAITFEDGNVKEVSASKSGRAGAPPADVHGRDVLDPLTALLIPGDLNNEACERIVRFFDGYQRFDVVLAFKRMRTVKAKDGYAGPALVCSGKYHQIAGQGGSPTLPSFFADVLAAREMEVILAPISGVRLLAPFQLTIETMVGNMMAQASRFKTAAP